MPPILLDLQQKIDGRVLRERGLIFLCALAVVFMLWNFLFYGVAASHQKDLEAQLNSIKTQNQTLSAQIATILSAATIDPDQDKKSTIVQLEAELAVLDSQLNSLSQGLVSAEHLPQILQDVLLKTGELTLVQLQTLPVQELQLAVLDPATDGKDVGTGAGVFKHEVRLRVTGSYFQLLLFFQTLEKYKWRFYWDQLDYDLAQYPRANIELRVYTLSAEEGLLGV